MRTLVDGVVSGAVEGMGEVFTGRLGFADALLEYRDLVADDSSPPFRWSFEECLDGAEAHAEPLRGQNECEATQFVRTIEPSAALAGRRPDQAAFFVVTQG